MKKATPAQIKKFHALLNEKRLMEHKADIVNEFTDGKQTSTKEMTMEQMIQAIEHLEANKNAKTASTKTKRDSSLDRQRKKIIGFCREMGMEKEKNGKTVADMDSVYKFILKVGYLKKDLNDYTAQEMPILVTVIEKIKDNVVPKLQAEKRDNWTVTDTETGETKKAKDILPK